MRGSGRTIAAMTYAPYGSLYIVRNHGDIVAAKHLAYSLKRMDLNIRTIHDIDGVRGCLNIVFDHTVDKDFFHSKLIARGFIQGGQNGSYTRAK